MPVLKSLQDPNSELVRLLDSLYDGIYVVDLDRNILFWNKAAERITGYKAEEVMGRSCKDNILNHIDENGVLLCLNHCPLLKAMEEDVDISAKVYPTHKDGHRFPVETHISNIRDDQGKIVAGIEIFRDVTHQEEYRIIQEKFKNLIRKYVSTTTFDDVMERAEGDATAGSPRLVDITVMYLDVVGFTGFSERNGSEVTMEMLNELFGICDVITRESLGDIDKFIGDAVMATFTDAKDAVKAARKILDKALPKMNKSRAERGLEEVQIRIGINSGVVIQGEIGTRDRRDLTVIGDTVNVAARVEKASPSNGLMISEATLARLDRKAISAFEFSQKIQLRGKEDFINLYLAKKA